MGFLVAAGFELIIAVALGLLVFIIGLFVGHIIVFEGIALGITAGAVAHKLLDVHLFFSILIAVAVFVLVYKIMTTSVGFWIISILLSLAWGIVVVGTIAYTASGADPIWSYGMSAVGTVVFILLHRWSRDRL